MTQTFNYPTHPLFQIAPLLDRGFQTVNFDPYERVLIAKIRAGRYVSDLFDHNSLYLSGQLGARVVGQPRFEAKSRYLMTAEQRKAYREEWDQFHAEERAKNAARDAEVNAERQRVKVEAKERQAAREEERKKRAREWIEEDERRAAERERIVLTPLPVSNVERLQEVRSILLGRWECSSCGRLAAIHEAQGAYVLECVPCGRSVSAAHATLVTIMLAHKARPQPATAG